jgi:hypothetical protein
MANMITLDFDADKLAELPPEGTYEFQIVKAEEKMSQNNNPMISIEAGIVGYADPVHNGKRMWENLVLIAASAWKLSAFCKGIGVPANNIDPDDWIGMTFFADVIQETSNTGTPMLKAKKYHPKV